MAYHIQSGFGSGELDPALHERTNFEKYKAGLKTLKNAFIGKTGRIISRPGSKYFLTVRSPTASVQNFTVSSVPNDIMVTPANHIFGTGTKVQVSSTGTLPAGLSASTDYYVTLKNLGYGYPTEFQLSTSLANALAGTKIDITSAGSGTHAVHPQTVTNKKVLIYHPPYSIYIIEWGERYLRVHNTSSGTYTEIGHDYTEADLPYIQFVPSGLYVYIFSKTFSRALRLTLSSGVHINAPWYVGGGSFGPGFPQPNSSGSSSTGTGHTVQYFASCKVGGQESFLVAVGTDVTHHLPILPAEVNNIRIETTFINDNEEIKIYRQPQGGLLPGYIGSIMKTANPQDYKDYGNDADYTQTGIKDVDVTIGLDIYLNGIDGVGVVYQNRMLVSLTAFPEVLVASRTGYFQDFYRDTPYSDDSALLFKASASDKSTVLRLMDAPNGLLVFTTTGVYQSSGALTPTNLALDKKGSWVIDETIPPLLVPGGILFIDRSTNSVRVLTTSQEAIGFSGEDLGVFSSHLFLNKTVKSWAFQDGDTPLIWIVMNDGSVNVLSYQREQQMQAWSHHHTDGLYESVTVVKNLAAKSIVYFVVNRAGVRSIEYLSDRFVADLKDYVCMDAAVTFKTDIAANSTATVTATTATNWDGLLTLTSDVAIFANTTDNGAVGTTFRFFDSQGSAVDLVVTTYTSTTVVVVQPSCLFPSAEATITKLYKTYSTLTGLSHLNGKSVSLMVDGYIEASPNNDVENYTALTPSGGSLTIPGGRRGAIVHVGLPYTCDVEPLDVDTVEQKPTLLESQLVHKVYLKVYNSRGLYVASQFPVNGKVLGMRDPEERTEDILLGNIGNAAQALTTKRLDIVIPNDWKSSGRVAIRQVDPLPFEILSIIPDLSVLV